MQEDCWATTHKLIVTLLATVGAALYLISMVLAYPVLQNTRLTDPLASIHSLVPLYYVAIVMIATTCFISFIYRIGNRGIHILIGIKHCRFILWYYQIKIVCFDFNPMKTPYLIEG